MLKIKRVVLYKKCEEALCAGRISFVSVRPYMYINPKLVKGFPVKDKSLQSMIIQQENTTNA